MQECAGVQRDTQTATAAGKSTGYIGDLVCDGALLWRGSDPHPVFLGNPTCLLDAVVAAWRHKLTLPVSLNSVFQRAAQGGCLRIYLPFDAAGKAHQ